VNRRIRAFVLDEDNDWIALLGCGHRQHVRHHPPFRDAPWVLDDQARDAHIGTSLDCPLCDRAELPVGLGVVRTTEVWDEHTIPTALCREHRIAPGTWGNLRVLSGQLHFAADTQPPIAVDLGAGDTQAIPPSVGHAITLVGPVQFCLDFLQPPEIADSSR
jgi:tellurite methyltransferase